MATLLSVGTLEKRSVLRKMLWEASRGQTLGEHVRLPPDPEPVPDPEQEIGALEPDELEAEELEEFEELEAEELEELEESELENLGDLEELDESELEDLDELEDGADREAEPETEIHAAPAGFELLAVTRALQRWLLESPHGPLIFGRVESGVPVIALACGWASTTVHALARQPLSSLAELDQSVDTLSGEQLRGYTETLVKVGLVEARRGDDGEPRYAVTEWLRAGIAPIAISARYELNHPRSRIAPADGLDVEAAFHLVLPRLELPPELSGSCRLSAEVGGSGQPSLAGVTARVERGRVASVTPGLDGAAGAWAVGSTGAWLATVIEPEVRRVKTGGDEDLVSALLDGLHETLFGEAG